MIQRHRATAARTAIVAFVLSQSSTAIAQLPFTPVEDATVAVRGDLRISITTFWERYGSRFGSTEATRGESEPLGARFSIDALGISHFPRLGGIQSAIAELSGLPGYSLSLGRTRVHAEVLETHTPFAADLAVTNWFSIGAAIPLVRVGAEVIFEADNALGGANAGLNPAATFGAARAANTAVRDELSAAALTLETALGACALDPEAPGCAALLGRQGEAESLITQSRQFRNTLESLYGSDTSPEQPLVPLQGTAAHEAIDARLVSFNALFRELLALESTEPDPLLARPFPAQTALTAAMLRQLLEEPGLGVGIVPLQGFRRQGLGDIEVRARLKLVDSFQSAGDRASAVRAVVSAVGRLGTGTAPSPEIPFDPGTGDAQNDVEVGAAADLRVARSLSLSIAGRFGVQLPATRTVRIAPPGTPFAEAFTVREVDLDLGDYLDVAANAGVRLGSYATILGGYSLHTKQADSYTGVFVVPAEETGRGIVTLDASVLNAGTAHSIHRAGVGLQLRNFRDRTTEVRLPAEFAYWYGRIINASGYGIPDATTHVLQLRTYLGVFGR